MAVQHSRQRAYSGAMSMRAQVLDFAMELGMKRGWALAAALFETRFRVELVAFLDAPTQPNLLKVLSFAEEIRIMDRRFPRKAP